MFAGRLRRLVASIEFACSRSKSIMQSLRPFARIEPFYSYLSQRTTPHRRMASSCVTRAATNTLQPLQELEQELINSINAVVTYQQEHPEVVNLNKLARRIRSDLQYIRQLCEQPLQMLTEARLQGVTNNLRGFRGEMMALREAPGVVAVCRKFRAPATAGEGASQLQQHASQLDSDSSSSSSGSYGSDVESPRAGRRLTPDGMVVSLASFSPSHSSGLADPLQLPAQYAPATGNRSSRSQRSDRSSSSSSSRPAAPAVLQVEVDVVADDGLTWIEVKNQELFGVASAHFVGGSHGKGLAEQVGHMLAIAAQPEHKRRGRSPQVVVYFPSGVDGEVAAALTALGAKVANGVGSLAPLCGVVGNNVTNLDVTTLCALVSEVSWRDPHCEALQAWATRTSHWRDCLAAQQQSPLLPELEAVIGQGRELVVSCAAITQFEILLQQFSGPTERQRWSELLPRLRVFHCSQSCNSDVQQQHRQQQQTGAAYCQQACCMCGGSLVQTGGFQAFNSSSSSSSTADQPSQQLEAFFPLSERLQSLGKMTMMQQAVFSLGDALHALTVTANGSAVRAAAACGVVLDVQQHRPVWLTGL